MVLLEYPDWWAKQQHGKHPNWPDEKYTGPAYDIDPVAALELLEWLAEKPRGWKWAIHSAGSYVRVSFYKSGGPGNGIIWDVKGLPSVALFEAIALAADKVRESEVK